MSVHGGLASPSHPSPVATVVGVGLVAGFPRFFPVRIDDSHHTPYNEEIR